jgi:hypothetical protein
MDKKFLWDYYPFSTSYDKIHLDEMMLYEGDECFAVPPFSD